MDLTPEELEALNEQRKTAVYPTSTLRLEYAKQSDPTAKMEAAVALVHALVTNQNWRGVVGGEVQTETRMFNQPSHPKTSQRKVVVFSGYASVLDVFEHKLNEKMNGGIEEINPFENCEAFRRQMEAAAATQEVMFPRIDGTKTSREEKGPTFSR